MLLPRSRLILSWVLLYGLHLCCLHRTTLPCATFQVFSSHTAGVFEFFDIGCLDGWGLRAYHCLLPGSLFCHWATRYRLLMCACQVQSFLMGPCYGLPMLLSPSAHTSAMCHFQVSSHSCWFPFC
ncbi:unnamed protein product, partial [Staurois parvus]